MVPSFGERLPEEQLGRVVVEDQHPAAVEEEHRRREVGRKLASQDQRQVRREGRVGHRITLLDRRAAVKPRLIGRHSVAGPER